MIYNLLLQKGHIRSAPWTRGREFRVWVVLSYLHEKKSKLRANSRKKTSRHLSRLIYSHIWIVLIKYFVWVSQYQLFAFCVWRLTTTVIYIRGIHRKNCTWPIFNLFPFFYIATPRPSSKLCNKRKGSRNWREWDRHLNVIPSKFRTMQSYCNAVPVIVAIVAWALVSLS